MSVAPAAAAPSARVVLATGDPVFAALCKRVLEAGNPLRLVAVPHSALLATARQVEPDLVVLDCDGEDAGALKTLAAKVALVSDASLVLVAAYLAPGSPGLGALLQSIAATFVQKPQGPSSLSLAGDDGPRFLAELQAAFAAQDDDDERVSETFDAAWGAGEDTLTTPNRSRP